MFLLFSGNREQRGEKSKQLPILHWDKSKTFQLFVPLIYISTAVKGSSAGKIQLKCFNLYHGVWEPTDLESQQKVTINQGSYWALKLKFQTEAAQRAKDRNHWHHIEETCPHSYIITPRGSVWKAKDSKASPAAILCHPANTCIFASFPCVSKTTLVQGVKPVENRAS